MTTQITPALDELFDGGSPRRLETAVRLVKSDNRHTIPRAVLISMIVWAPLILFASMQSFALGQDKLSDLPLDFAVHAHSLVAVPLFIVAQSFTLSTLGCGNHCGAVAVRAGLVYEIPLHVILPDLMKLLL
jgi:hypothetical protein